jgi:hypothetical protein
VYTSPGFLSWIYKYQKKCTPQFITLGYDTNRWKKNKQIKKLGKEKKIFYIGNIDQTINLIPLINGIKDFKDWSLTIIGGGDIFEETKRYVFDNHIGNVFFLGFVKMNEVPLILEEFHISAIPFIKATLPNKLFDSIGSYKPILAFGDNDTTKFVKKHQIGWTLSFDENEVKKFLEEIIDKDILRKSNNIKKIRKQFSKDFLYVKYLDYIKMII